jgi:cell division protease FtsH
MYRKKHEILSHIKVLLAGRAAEEVVFSKENITTGAVNDIKEASKEIYAYFNQYGMDENNGLFSLEINNALDDAIVDDCKLKMKTLYNETKTLLVKNEKLLQAITAELLNKETLSGEEIDELLGFSQLVSNM